MGIFVTRLPKGRGAGNKIKYFIIHPFFSIPIVMTCRCKIFILSNEFLTIVFQKKNFSYQEPYFTAFFFNEKELFYELDLNYNTKWRFNIKLEHNYFI